MDQPTHHSQRLDPVLPRVVSRRTVIGSATAIVAASVLSATRATADSGGAELRAFANDSWVASTSGDLTSVPSQLGVELIAGSFGVPAGAVVTINYDSRLYEFAEPRLQRSDGTHIPCKTNNKRVDPAGHATTTVAIGQALPVDDSIILTAGARKPLYYPQDLIHEPIVTTLTLSMPSTQRAPLTLRGGEGRKRVPMWGVAVGVGWERIKWEGGFHTWVPKQVTLGSTGPDSAPAGALLATSIDAQLFPFMQMRPSSGAFTTVPYPQSPSVTKLVSSLKSDLAPGSHVSVSLETGLMDMKGPLHSFHMPTVEAFSSAVSVGQRITGCESATRVDSAYNAETLSLYGLGQ